MLDPDLIPPDRGTYRVSYALARRTLGDLGDALPHGLADGGEALRTFGLRRPTMGLQKQVGALRQDATLAKRPGALLVRFLARVLSHLGGRDLGSLDDARAAELVGRLTVGDVLFLGFAWQRARHPRGLPLGDVDCGSCGRALGDVRVDLDSLEVTVVDSDRDLLRGAPRAVVRLWEPIPLPSGKLVDLVEVRSPAWGAAFGRLAADSFGRNRALMQARTFAASIAGARAGEDDLVGLPESALDELMPDDVKLLDEAIEAVTPSLDLGIEVACPHCGASNRTTLDWQSEAFYSAS